MFRPIVAIIRFSRLSAKEFYIIRLNRVAMLRSHHHLRAFVTLSSVGCLLSRLIKTDIFYVRQKSKL